MSPLRQLVLAVDTSGADAGLVLSGADGIETASLPVRGGFARTEDLAAEAAALLARRGCRPSDLTAVAAVVGPGSYTGLRSGLAFLRGLAFVDSLPAVAVGTLELLAWRTAEAGEVATVVWPAGKGRSVVAVYHCGDADVEEILAPVVLDDGEAVALVASNRECSNVVVTLAGTSEQLAGAPDRHADAPEEHADAPDALASAARAAGLALRTPAPGGLARLATLVTSRLRAGKTSRSEELVPVYVGLAALRPDPNARNVLTTRE